MTRDEARARARALAAASLGRGDAGGWFEELYRGAEGDASKIPWVDHRPNSHLVEWLERERVPGVGTALVVGCGLGDDAEELARRGFKVTAFDLSASAIEWCKRRFPQSVVEYVACDLSATPVVWHQAFGLVFEAFTLQAMPPEARTGGFAALARLVAPEGRLLVVTRAREADEPMTTLPWPLSREELRAFDEAGLHAESFEDFVDRETPPVRRFRATWWRAPLPAGETSDAGRRG